MEGLALITDPPFTVLGIGCVRRAPRALLPGPGTETGKLKYYFIFHLQSIDLMNTIFGRFNNFHKIGSFKYVVHIIICAKLPNKNKFK